MTHVKCQVSSVTIFCFVLDKAVELVGRGFVINGAYHVKFLDLSEMEFSQYLSFWSLELKLCHNLICLNFVTI